jgi:hypothetical protein
MKKIIKLTESDLTKIVKTVLNKKSYIFEQDNVDMYYTYNNDKYKKDVNKQWFKWDNSYQKWNLVDLGVDQTYNINLDKSINSLLTIDTNPPKEKEVETNKERNRDTKKTTGCINGNCKNGYGTFIFKNKSKYVGNWKNGQFNGTGKMIYSDKTIYHGNYNNSVKDGEGKFKNKYGKIFQGTWKNDTLNGKTIQQLNLIPNWVDTDNKNKKEKENTKEKSWFENPLDNIKKKDENNNSNKPPITKEKWDNYPCVTSHSDRRFTKMKDGSKSYIINGFEYFNNGQKQDKKTGESSKFTCDDPEFQNNNNTTPPTVTDCSTSTQPTTATHRYEGDRNYEYAQVGDCWWAHNVNNDKWFNISQMAATTNPKFQSSIDNLNNGKTNGKLVMILGS